MRMPNWVAARESVSASTSSVQFVSPSNLIESINRVVEKGRERERAINESNRIEMRVFLVVVCSFFLFV